MSDDLISRRSILNKINEWSNKLSCENGKQFTLAEFEHIVANEPTAYDVDKAICLMKANSEVMQRIISETFDKELVYPIQKLFRTYINSLINNVKSGGVADEQIGG